MWINDHKLFELIRGWRDTAKDYPASSYSEAMEDAANALEQLIDEEQAPMPAPSEGSERCMIYTRGPR